MHIRHLNIHEFRNLCQTELQFSNSANFIFGDNAQGKTNIIEAIYILCLAKSFRTHNDVEMLPFDKTQYLFEGSLQNESAVSYRIQVMFTSETGKKIKIDGKPVTRYSTMIGKFPIVALTTEDHVITSGAPSQRRKFFNILLSQSSARYLDDLKSFERVLKQRNELLSRQNVAPDKVKSQLDIWNEQLIRAGCSLIMARQQIVKEMNNQVNSHYQVLTRSTDVFNIQYQPNVSDKNNDLAKAFNESLKKAWPHEKRRGMTLVGPHRDEFLFTVNGKELRKYGSRGEHKSALVSLKAAESVLLSEKSGTAPILLLDDLYSELDINRAKSVLELFAGNSQTFITGTSMDYQAIKNMGIESPNHTLYFVKQGAINQSNGTYA